MYKSKYLTLIDFLTNQEDLILLDSEIQNIENLIDKDLKAINYTRCCESDSELLTCDNCKHNCLVWDDKHPCATCAGMDNYVAR